MDIFQNQFWNPFKTFARPFPLHLFLHSGVFLAFIQVSLIFPNNTAAGSYWRSRRTWWSSAAPAPLHHPLWSDNTHTHSDMRDTTSSTMFKDHLWHRSSTSINEKKYVCVFVEGGIPSLSRWDCDLANLTAAHCDLWLPLDSSGRYTFTRRRQHTLL